MGSMVLAYSYGGAQSLTATNYTSVVLHPNPLQVAQVGATIHNTTGSAIAVMVERTANILAPNHTSYFCWDVCYGETVDMSTNPINIQANDSSIAFYSDLDPHGFTGIDTGCYKFFDQNNAGDFVEICFYFDVTTGVNTVTNSQTNPLSFASPNPANTYCGIGYYTDLTKNPSLVVYNMLGGKVYETKLTQKYGAHILNVADFKQGIYLYSLIENGKTVATRKLVVSHK